MYYYDIIIFFIISTKNYSRVHTLHYNLFYLKFLQRLMEPTEQGRSHFQL